MLKTREEWITRLAGLLSPTFAARGYTLPLNVRFSCGWPGGGSRGTRIGECWHSRASADGHFEVFISPSMSEPVQVAAILVHELVHTAVGLEAGHGPLFKSCAFAVGKILHHFPEPCLLAVATQTGSVRPQLMRNEMVPLSYTLNPTMSLFSCV